MTLDATLLKNLVNVAKEIVSEQTRDDLANITAHFGAAFSEMELTASLAVEIALRLYSKVDQATRAVSPVSGLAAQGVQRYVERFAL